MIVINLRLIRLIRNYLKSIKIIFFICTVMLFPLFLTQANSQSLSDKKILVIYPESSATYQRIYDIIIKGMKSNSNIDILSKTFANNSDVTSIEQQVKKTNANAVIALGKTGKLFSQQLKLDVPIITGAHVIAETGKASVSLDADPYILFKRLILLKPNIKTVYVIYNKRNTHWLIKNALITSKKFKLKLKIYAADDINHATFLLKKVTEQAKENTSAIWLPLDPIFPIEILLPELLRVAWNKKLVVFSNNPVDVQKGVLFAMYPDYKKIGLQLVNLAISCANGDKIANPEPSRHLNSAINRRTAAHLDIKVNQNHNTFNLFFPEQL